MSARREAQAGDPSTTDGAAASDERAHRADLARLLGQLGAPLDQAGLISADARKAAPAELAGEIGAPPRRLAPQPPFGLVSAILGEIDTTVMARTLRLCAPSGQAVLLEASNRRLLHYSIESAADPSNATPAPAAKAPAGLAALSDLALLFDTLQGLCRDGSVTVEARAPSGLVGAEATGVAVSTLQQAFRDAAEGASAASAPARPEPEQAMAVGADVPDEAERLAGFARSCGSDVSAWLLDPGSDLDSPAGGMGEGGRDRTAALGRALALWKRAAADDAGHGAGAVLIGAPPGQGQSLFLGRGGAVWLAMAVRPGAAKRVFAAWIARHRPGHA